MRTSMPKDLSPRSLACRQDTWTPTRNLDCYKVIANHIALATAVALFCASSIKKRRPQPCTNSEFLDVVERMHHYQVAIRHTK